MRFSKKARFWCAAGVLLLSLGIGFACGGCSRAAEAPSGIDPEKFAAAVASHIDEFNAQDFEIGDLTAQTGTSGIIGYVDITLSDPTAWNAYTDAEKKDCLTDLGKALDALAIDTAYPGTLSRVGTDTMLYSPDGGKLAERTSLGIVLLYSASGKAVIT